MLIHAHRPGRTFALWAAVLLLALAAAGCGGSKNDKGAPSDFSAKEGTLDMQAARVEWKDGSSAVWSPVSARQAVKGSDAIRTDTSGRALLTLYSGTQVDILPGSELIVHNFDQSPEGGAVVTLEQLTGETFHRVNLVADTNSRYELDTPVVHLVVRGTVFGVQVAPSGATTVEVQQGTVQAQVGVQQFAIPAGQALDVDAQKNTSGPRPIAMPAGTPTPTMTITPFPTSAFQAPVFTATSTINAILPPPASVTFTPPFTVISTVTEAPSPTLPPTATETPPPGVLPAFPFAIQQGMPVLRGNPGSTGCKWQGIAGQVTDAQGQPVIGLVVRVTGLGAAETTTTGTNTLYGPSGWEITVSDAASAGEWVVELLSAAGGPVSPAAKIVFPGACDQNLALIDFFQTRSLQ